jgi:hypothetical protein
MVSFGLAGDHDHPARNARALGSCWVSPVLAMEVPVLGGRPQIDGEPRALIRRMSVENPLWGATRIHGELLKLGFEVAQCSASPMATASSTYRSLSRKANRRHLNAQESRFFRLIKPNNPAWPHAGCQDQHEPCTNLTLRCRFLATHRGLDDCRGLGSPHGWGYHEDYSW